MAQKRERPTLAREISLSSLEDGDMYVSTSFFI